jgi:hypothetical protein
MRQAWKITYGSLGRHGVEGSLKKVEVEKTLKVFGLL